jgi:hypothetical protein
MGRISKKGMFGLFTSALCFAASIFLPWWALRLIAPQYQEGLYVWVYPYQLEGDVDIINSLNHYIGMAEFTEASFPELSFLAYIIGGIALITMIIAIIRSRKLLAVWTGIVLILSAIGIWDIYRWLRVFGTNLDPTAAIEIEPFVPPIFGTNQLANFETFSFFSYGAVLGGIAIILLILVLWKGKERHD